jgi:hypothetical protein
MKRACLQAGSVHLPLRIAALALLCAGAIACSSKASPPAEKERPSASAAPASAVAPAPRASASAAPGPSVPTLAPEKFAPGGKQPEKVFAVEGAIMVVDGFRVGRVVDDGVEWIKKTVPAEHAGYGPNMVDGVVGRWPDSIGALYSNTNGRAPSPTYFPLTGVGNAHTVAAGGGWGDILGVARVGESTLLASNSPGDGVELMTVRGTVVRRPMTPEQAGCKPGELRESYGTPPPAITPAVVAATRAGTLVSIGRLCEKRAPAAEIWDKSGKSRIVDLGRFWKKVGYRAQLLPGDGDELWAFSDAFHHVLHYRDGQFEAVPDLLRPIQNVFVSPRGQLHAYDGRTIHRLEGSKWIAVAHLAEPLAVKNMALDDQGTFWVHDTGVSRLRPAPSVEVPEGCATPFVYLYDVSYDNGPTYTYPTTRKALSTFADVGALGLVEFGSYPKRLGVTVATMAQGEAVVAHVRQTMKDEDPVLVCYAPDSPRKIDMDAKN